MAKAVILGAGTWGTALARALYIGNNEVTLWSTIESEIINLSETRKHPNLHNFILPDGVDLETDIGRAVCGKDIIVVAVPSPYMRLTARMLSEKCDLRDEQIIVSVAKGLEDDSFKTMTEVIADEIGNPNVRILALSGPTHAEEVALDMPTAIVASGENDEALKLVQSVFSNPFMRVYTNNDIKAIEICGALKNIIAIAAGISSGLGYGDNAKAAIITRGMIEITRLCCAAGCSDKVFSSLAGIGDLVVTCTSSHSRNNTVGFLIGKGMSPSAAISEIGMVVEGINALPGAIGLSRKYNTELPLCELVSKIISGDVRAKDALDIMMSREFKAE